MNFALSLISSILFLLYSVCRLPSVASQRRPRQHLPRAGLGAEPGGAPLVPHPRPPDALHLSRWRGAARGPSTAATRPTPRTKTSATCCCASTATAAPRSRPCATPAATRSCCVCWRSQGSVYQQYISLVYIHEERVSVRNNTFISF